MTYRQLLNRMAMETYHFVYRINTDDFYELKHIAHCRFCRRVFIRWVRENVETLEA